MYVTFEELKDLIAKKSDNENPGIFVESMGQCYEPVDIEIDKDGDVIIFV